jgi:DNA-binding NarL/FixJ family response regulator
MPEEYMEEITILVADDHTLMREGTRQLLQHEPELRVVGEAENGEQAVVLAEQLLPDVVLLDMRLPVLNGIEATKRIVAANPSVRVLIVSAYDDEDYVMASLQAGASGYLLKTAPARELIDAIHSVHHGNTVLQSSVSRKLSQRLTSGGARAAHASDLTPRELEVLRLIAHGLPNKQIAAELGISLRTVEGHLNNIFGKLGVASRTEAILHGVQQHLISFEDSDQR